VGHTSHYACYFTGANGSGAVAVDDQTWFYIVNTPQQRPDPILEAAIQQALVAPEDLAHEVGFRFTRT
jgi:hypothetical protein